MHHTQNVLEHMSIELDSNQQEQQETDSTWENGLDQEMVKTYGQEDLAQTSNDSRPKGINKIPQIQGSADRRTGAQSSNGS